MGYLAMIFGLGMVVSFAQSHDLGEVVLYSEKNFQGNTIGYSSLLAEYNNFFYFLY